MNVKKKHPIIRAYQKNPLQTITLTIALIISLIGVATNIINFFTASRLDPIVKDLNTVVRAEAENQAEHKFFVTAEQLKEAHVPIIDDLRLIKEALFIYK